jgi:hypothetical protein
MRPKRYVTVILAPVVGYLAVLLLVAVFVVKPPPLGWVGFGVAAAIGLLIGALAAAVFPHSRASGVHIHPLEGDRFRLLVVVDAHCSTDRLGEALRSKIVGRAAELLVVAPVLASPHHFLTDDEGQEREDARARLTETLQTLSRFGIESRGVVGSDDPLQAIADALAGFSADEIVLVAMDDRHRLWLEQGIERQARDLYGVHVTTLTADTDVASGAPR